MEQRTLEVNVLSAKDLKNVNLFSKMDVYVVVSISGDPQHPEQTTKTPIDREDGSNPTWNFPIKFTIYDAPAQQNRLNLFFRICCDRALGDKDVGQVIVPVKELLECMGDGKSMQFVIYQVSRSSGKPRGELRFSYRFGDKVISSDVQQVGENPGQRFMPYPSSMVSSSSAAYGGAVTYNQPAPPARVAGFAYPPSYAGYAPPTPPPGYAYPPPPPGYAYPPPSPAYGYPAGQQAEYGYYSPVQQPPKKNKFGMRRGSWVALDL